ncbi:hypothetical protein MLD38_032828 [Melastoma candidum]|uniref:Uncharacterized protein n=2 Tax=Melastoma candidum TaxID=119954 RepID=A0ACB9M4J3_9MYRT|nr:hypothetical protein MLD38_032828 [Melastoma candidum]
MAPNLVHLVFLLLALITPLILFLLGRSRGSHRLPPGPRPLPVIGNLHQLNTLVPHRKLLSLSRIYGPIMQLRLGLVPTVVVSSPRAAESFLKTHDVAFSSRPRLEVLEVLPYRDRSTVFSPVNGYWRQMRRFCVTNLVNKDWGMLRRETFRNVMERIADAVAAKGGVGATVDVSEVLRGGFEDMACRMVFGCWGEREGVDIGTIVHEYLMIAAKMNTSDYLPFLRPFDVLGLAKRAKKINETFDQVIESIIRQHDQNNLAEQEEGDFIRSLLTLLGQAVPGSNSRQARVIDRESIKAVLLDMILGSFESTWAVVEWAMSELMRNPRVMECLQGELQTIVGMSRMVEESDLRYLDYLEMVVKETFRLYPPGPLLVPHEAAEDTVVEGGYFIQKGTRVFINVWAIGRDHEVWKENPEEFYPERFIGSRVDVKGCNFELIPFGAGRRICPGMNVGLTSIKLALAQFVHCFDWKLPTGMSPADLDMTEEVSLTLTRASHLRLVPSYRLLA